MGKFKLHINQELQNLLPPLTQEEDLELDQSIQTDGQWVSFPLTVSPDGTICDGMNRYGKLTKYGKLPILYAIDKSLDTLHKQKIFVLRNVLARRNLNTWQKGLATIKFLELLPIGIDDALKKSQSSKRTFYKVQAIHRTAPEHIKKKLDKGSLSVDTAYKIITQKERNLPKIDAPKGIPDCILCDIPIAFDNATIRGAASNHYPTMTVEELKAFKVHTAKDAIIFFWISPAVLLEGLDILQHWGFVYKTHFMWEKDKFGNGSWCRNQHEMLIVGIKGTMPTPAELFSSVIKAKRTSHSKKPEIYDMIEKMYPQRQYLELFTRFKDSRKNWVFHGNEIKV